MPDGLTEPTSKETKKTDDDEGKIIRQEDTVNDTSAATLPRELKVYHWTADKVIAYMKEKHFSPENVILFTTLLANLGEPTNDVFSLKDDTYTFYFLRNGEIAAAPNERSSHVNDTLAKVGMKPVSLSINQPEEATPDKKKEEPVLAPDVEGAEKTKPWDAQKSIRDYLRL